MYKEKKSFGRKLLIRLIILLLVISAAAVLYYIYYLNLHEKLSFHISPGVIVINDIWCSAYLIKTDSGYIAVDTGFDERVVRKGLEYQGIKPEQIKAVLLTHSDLDHVALLDLYPHADAYISNEEVKMVERGATRFYWLPFYKNSLPDRKYNLLEDWDEIKVHGVNIRCILIPGHTDGSMAYLVDGKYLFTGDAFRLKNGKISSPFRTYVAMNPKQMSLSFYKLFDIPGVQYIFTANSGFTADFKKSY